MSFLDTFCGFGLDFILHKSTSQTLKNTLVMFLGMSKGRVQSLKPLENFHWQLDYPSNGYSMALFFHFELPCYNHGWQNWMID